MFRKVTARSNARSAVIIYFWLVICVRFVQHITRTKNLFVCVADLPFLEYVSIAGTLIGQDMIFASIVASHLIFYLASPLKNGAQQRIVFMSK